MKLKTKHKKIDLLSDLKVIAPGIAFSVSRKHDEHYVWDESGRDPRGRGFLPYVIVVKARSIIHGELLEGSASICGSYYKPEEPIGDIHGYLPQMLMEAAEILDSQICARFGVHPAREEALAAVQFLRAWMEKQ